MNKIGQLSNKLFKKSFDISLGFLVISIVSFQFYKSNPNEKIFQDICGIAVVCFIVFFFFSLVSFIEIEKQGNRYYILLVSGMISSVSLWFGYFSLKPFQLIIGFLSLLVFSIQMFAYLKLVIKKINANFGELKNNEKFVISISILTFIIGFLLNK